MRTTHFYITNQEQSVEDFFSTAYIASVNGIQSSTINGFVAELGEALDFPENQGKNLDAVEMLLNDLQWIEEDTVVLFVSNSADWLLKEKGDKAQTVIDLLDAIAEDWAWTDDDDEDFTKKELKIVFQDSGRIQDLLNQKEIPFQTIR